MVREHGGDPGVIEPSRIDMPTVYIGGVMEQLPEEH